MSQSDTDSQYVVVSVLDYGKGGEGAVIGRAETLDGAHKLGETGSPDRSYPWYRIYRRGKMVVEVHVTLGSVWDPASGTYVEYEDPDPEHQKDPGVESGGLPLPPRSEWPERRDR